MALSSQGHGNPSTSSTTLVRSCNVLFFPTLAAGPLRSHYKGHHGREVVINFTLIEHPLVRLDPSTKNTQASKRAPSLRTFGTTQT
ncbi:hypothetical protein CR513_59774, partial [Mucuna pruriens]